MMIFSFFAIPAFMATSFVIVLVSLKKDEYVPFVALTGCLMALTFSLLGMGQVIADSPITMQMEEWVAPYGITIYADFLSVTLATLTSFTATMIVIFSFRYIRGRRTKYYALLSLMFAGVLGVIHTGDVFNMFVFIELVSIATYGLIAFRKNAISLEASIKYLIMGSLGTSLLLIGIALLYSITGTLNFADLAIRIPEITNPALAISFGLMFSGLAIKVGLVPFHTLHLDGYQAAPAPISAVLAAVVANVGVYAILRVAFIIFDAPGAFFNIMLILGVVSMMLGSVLALRQDNLKRMLAYSGVSQVGFVAMSVGLGTMLGLAGGLFHMLNIFLIESLLFLSAGAVIYVTKTSDLSKISGRMAKDNVLSFAFLTGVLALAGIPLFSGFASKWIIYMATLEVSPALTIITVISSALTLAYGLKAYSVIFSGSRAGGRLVKVPMSMKLPLIIFSLLIILIGLLPWIGGYAAANMAVGLDNLIYIAGVPL